MTERRCEFESKSFPESDFEYDGQFGWVHKVEPRHTTVGDILTATPPVPSSPPTPYPGTQVILPVPIQVIPPSLGRLPF